MKLVIDMNLSPDWVPVLLQAGHAAMHWSSIDSFLSNTVTNEQNKVAACYRRSRADA